jgi:hypothetical protein
MSNSWIPNSDDKQSTSAEEFDLFAPPAEDNLQEVLSRGSYKWTNKYTAVLGIALLVVTSGSAGIWYGHRTTSSGTNFSSNGFNRSSFGNRANSSTAAAGSSSNLNSGTGAFDPNAVGGGFNRGASATVSSVDGKKVTLTLESDPTVKKGDSVTLRASNARGGNGGNTSTSTNAGVSSASGTKAGSSKTNTTTTTKSGATPAPSISSQGRGGGRFGGFTDNPEFVACMKKEGITVSSDTPPDRNDPKTAAALQTCFQTLGGTAGGFGGGAKPNPSSTPKP